VHAALPSVATLAANLTHRDYEFLLEVDFQRLETRRWSDFYQMRDPRVLTNPTPYSHYDGEPILVRERP